MDLYTNNFTRKNAIATIGMFIILALIIGLVVLLVIIKPIPGLLSIFSSSLPNQGSQEEQNLVSYIKEIIGNDPAQAIVLCNSFLKDYSQSKLVPEVFYLKLYASLHTDLNNDGSSPSLSSSLFSDMVASEDSRKLVESFASSTSSSDDSYRVSAQFYAGLLAIRSAKNDPQKMADFLVSDIPSTAIFLTPDFASSLKSSVMPYDLVMSSESFEYAGVVVLVDSKHCDQVADIYLNKTHLDLVSRYLNQPYFEALYTYFFIHCDTVASSRYTSIIEEYQQDNRGGQGISRLRNTLYKSSYQNKIKALDTPYINNNPLQAIVV